MLTSASWLIDFCSVIGNYSTMVRPLLYI